MKDNFNRSLARVLVYEGGYSNNPKDPGGPTMKGITQSTFNSWRARQGQNQLSVSQITTTEVAAIYKEDYWDRIDADALPSGVDFCMFDAAVNSGVGGATKWAQAIVGVNPDGDYGPKTEAAILAADPDEFIHGFCSHRLGTLQRLRTWGTFGKGWAARIANVQKTALAWADAADAPDAVQVHTVGGNAKAKSSDIPVSTITRLVTHAGTMGGVIATGAAQAGQALAPASDTLSWVKYVLAGLTVVGAAAGLVTYLSKSANDAAAGAVRTAAVDPDADADVPSVKTLPQGTQIVTGAGTAAGAANG